MMTITANLLKEHEGFRRCSYRCTEGKLTIGYGYNLEANPLHLSEIEIEALLRCGISRKYAETLLLREIEELTVALAKQLTFFDRLGEMRKSVLINMAYNMGVPRFMGFKNTLALISAGRYETASTEMLKSKWAHQVGDRAKELSNMMRTGKATGS